MTDRERFEAWIRTCRRRSTERTQSGVCGAGMYYDPEVEFAWEAWQEAQRTGIEDIGKALKETGAGVEDDDD